MIHLYVTCSFRPYESPPLSHLYNLACRGHTFLIKHPETRVAGFKGVTFLIIQNNTYFYRVFISFTFNLATHL